MTVGERKPILIRQTMTRIPTASGEYQLALYSGNGDNKEHMALVIGDVAGRDDVLIRIHSECFTGDVLGSLRCDCGEQLERAMQEISANGVGVILYLRQEGRGIGLLEKLRAYNLQDLGHDTIEANLMLGHEADTRDYTVAAEILNDLRVRSVQVMTNNPLKIAALSELGITITRRVPIEVYPSPDNLGYLRTKAGRMNHMLELGEFAHYKPANGNSNGNGHSPDGHCCAFPESLTAPIITRFSRPAVTVSYAQSIDGSIADSLGGQVTISGKQSMTMTHRLRAGHDAILVGIGTALNDDPRLTVRLVAGDNPRPVIVDSRLRLEPNAAVFTAGHNEAWIVTTEYHNPERRQALEAAGATVMVTKATGDGQVDLGAMLDLLGEQGIRSLMVEGGSRIIRSFLAARLIDQLIITVSPRIIAGKRVLGERTDGNTVWPGLTNVHYQRLGDDIVVWGRPQWEPA